MLICAGTTTKSVLAVFTTGAVIVLVLIVTQGGTIKGSLNLPAQSLYYSLSTVYNLLRAGGVKYIVWYCGMWFWIWPLGPDVLCLALVDKSILID